MNFVRSQLKRWKIKNTIMIKGRDDPREATHRLMDGGNVHVAPGKMLNLFQTTYANDR